MDHVESTPGSPYRLFHISFQYVNTVAFHLCTRLMGLNRFKDVWLSLQPIKLQPALRHVGYRSLDARLTICGWLPLPYRDFTLLEPPSFAWRTNVSRSRRRFDLHSSYVCRIDVVEASCILIEPL